MFASPDHSVEVDLIRFAWLAVWIAGHIAAWPLPSILHYVMALVFRVQDELAQTEIEFQPFATFVRIFPLGEKAVNDFVSQAAM